jgi:hypothetical protein
MRRAAREAGGRETQNPAPEVSGTGLRLAPSEVRGVVPDGTA